MYRYLPVNIFAIATCLLIASCRDDVQAPAQQDPGVAAQANASTSGDSASGISTDERVALAVVDAMNSYEIAAGEQALQKGMEGAVADYAHQMISSHRTNKNRIATLQPDASSTDALVQARRGEAALMALAVLDGDRYRAAYVAAVIESHRYALDHLDKSLIPTAVDSVVKRHLQQTRAEVEHHLEMAQALAAATGGREVSGLPHLREHASTR